MIRVIRWQVIITLSDYIIAEFDDHQGASELAKHMAERGLVCVVKPIRKRDDLVHAHPR